MIGQEHTSLWKNMTKANTLRILSRAAKCQKHCIAAAGVELAAQLEEKESRMVMRRVLFLPGQIQR